MQCRARAAVSQSVLRQRLTAAIGLHAVASAASTMTCCGHHRETPCSGLQASHSQAQQPACCQAFIRAVAAAAAAARPAWDARASVMSTPGSGLQWSDWTDSGKPHPGCGGGGGGTSSAPIAAALVGLTGSLPSSDTGLMVLGTGSPLAAGEKLCAPACAIARRSLRMRGALHM